MSQQPTKTEEDGQFQPSVGRRLAGRAIWVFSLLFFLGMFLIPTLINSVRLTSTGIIVAILWLSVFAAGLVWIFGVRDQRRLAPESNTDFIRILASGIMVLNGVFWYVFLNELSIHRAWVPVGVVSTVLAGCLTVLLFTCYRQTGRPHKWSVRFVMLATFFPWVWVAATLIYVFAFPGSVFI